MDKLLVDLVNWIHNKNDKIMIGISGHGAAGKTTFTDKLINALDDKDVNHLNTDPYIIGSNLRNHAPIKYKYKDEDHLYKMTACHPYAHHTSALERDVKMIRDGLDFYTIDTHYRKSERFDSQYRVNIIEGMTVAFVNPQLFDLKIYFYTDSETEFLRRSVRDINERGMDINFLKQSHEERRIQYELFMHPYHTHFDIVIKNSTEDFFLEKYELPEIEKASNIE
ncbi:uridine kinase family protein [Bacillaceae bacterium W0354]